MDPSAYTFYFEDRSPAAGRRAAPLFDIAYCSNDEDAKVLALRLLARKDAQHVVEVWVDNYPVMTITDQQSAR